MTGKYEQIGAAVGRIVDKKQKAYGDAFHKMGIIIRTLYPHGIQPDQYDDILAIVRIQDKFFRIATHKKDPMGENPWHDVAGYGNLMCDDMENEDDPSGHNPGKEQRTHLVRNGE